MSNLLLRKYMYGNIIEYKTYCDSQGQFVLHVTDSGRESRGSVTSVAFNDTLTADEVTELSVSLIKAQAQGTDNPAGYVENIIKELQGLKL